MSRTVCLAASALDYPEGGGHFWIHMNWSLGLLSAGCRVVWLETINTPECTDEIIQATRQLRARLAPYGLGDSIALAHRNGDPLSVRGCDVLDLDAAAEADLLLNIRYDLGPHLVRRFRRSAVVDMDPGLLQLYIARGDIQLAPHDTYFTIGETVGRPGAPFPDDGIRWQYTPPCVALDQWPVGCNIGEAYTTVSHWYMHEWIVEPDGTYYRNDKRSGFEPYLDLPGCVSVPLELALCLGSDDEERQSLERRGWRIRDAQDVAGSPDAYHRYIHQSRGEFSCAKPSYVKQQTSWISDRTLCFLASGKPAVVQHTGPSRFLPDAAGLFRFRDIEEAVRSLELAETEYERHSRLARQLAEEHFDARKVVGRVIERALS